MDNQQIFSHTDHTLLTPTATWSAIQALCDEAIRYQTASVCVPPSYVRAIYDTYGSKLNICTVIGFPLGYSVAAAKLEELRQAKADGAAEFDMVVNGCDVKNGAFDKITAEIAQLKAEAADGILKVIIETCNLTEKEKIALCACVTEAGADYIKTSTGFGTAGAVMADILLFQKHIGPEVKIKAAGGIRTRQDMVDFLNVGCDRLGTSAAVRILTAAQ